MNIVTIAGNLGSDPEVRYTSSGQKVVSLRIASRVRRSGKDETIWWRATIWGDQFDKMVSFLKKGSSVIVVGDMAKPEIFTGKDGQPQISMGVTINNIMFSPFGRGGDNSSSKPNYQKESGEDSRQQQTTEYGKSEEEFSEEEIPF